jgi:predicted transcriptional regulator
MKMETVALNDQERRVFKRVAQTRLARVSEISRDLNIDTSTTLTILRALKGHSLVAEERSGSEMLSVYYLTTDGLAEARKLF